MTRPAVKVKQAPQFFDGKIKDALLLADIKRAVRSDIDVILFNIDSKADAANGRAAVLSVFWRVFNEMQGFCGHYPPYRRVGTIPHRQR